MGRGTRAIVATALGAGVGLVALAPSAMAATPATITLLPGGPTSASLNVRTTTGATAVGALEWFRLRVTPAEAPSVEVRGFCDDPEHIISPNRTYAVELRNADDAPDLASAGYSAVSYLLRRTPDLVAAAADNKVEVAALQVAIWQLGGRVPLTGASNNAAVNTRAAELRAMATGAATPTAPAAKTAAAQACAASGRIDVAITGAPGARAAIQVAEGTATTSVPTVVLGRDGTASVTVRAATAGRSVVRVRVEAGVLTRAARPGNGIKGPQETVFVTPAENTIDVPVNFTNCAVEPGVEPGGAPATPPVTAPAPTPTPTKPAETPAAPAPVNNPVTDPGTLQPNQTAPKLTVAKRGPASTRAGGTLRYSIVVKNSGSAAAENVKVDDTLPLTASVVSRGAASLRSGRLVWSVGRLAAGASRTLVVVLRADGDATARICNTVVATGDGSLRASDRTCARIVGAPARVIPAVTG
jgi:uncharacterized repeat protein (TIGR01451 family)